MTEDDKLCFVISPIGDQDSDTRKRSDQVLKHVIRPAVSKCGFKAIRADEIDAPGMITSQVIQHVVNDPLVVADLTERNPNVFYELAIRHALRKPLVQIIQQGETIPFDVAGTRTVFVDHRDLDSVEEAKNEIVKQVRVLEQDESDIETPISVSLDLQRLRQSTDPAERSRADLLAAVLDVRTSLGKVEQRIGTKDKGGLLDDMQRELRRLQARLDRDIEGFRMLRMRRHQYHPLMLRELMHFSQERNPRIGLLIIASLFRDSLPWLYEMGMEVYRMARHPSSPEVQVAATEFREMVEFAVHGPMASHLFERKEMSMIIGEIEPILNRSLALLRA